MKCEKCNNNEAVFHYQSIINGKISEYHLCADCAREAGFGDMLDYQSRSMLSSFFGEPFGFINGFFSDPLGSFDQLTGGFFGQSLFTPALEAPIVKVAIGETEKADESEKARADKIPGDAGEEFRRKREIHALRHKLREAVKAEAFEKAAELRDKIHELEK